MLVFLFFVLCLWSGQSEIMALFFLFCFKLWSVALVLNFLGAFTKLQKGAISFVMPLSRSVHLYARNNSAPTRCIYMKIDI
jgi:hypothetical protein